MDACRLAIRNLCKSFAVPVLQDLKLDLAAGEIHAIVGENGAGKSTLVNLLTGLLPVDGGEFFLDGERYAPAGARDSFAAGISFAAQELGLVDSLTVAENIALRKLPHRLSVLDRHALEAQASAALARLDASHISPASKPGSLGLADRQLVELAKAMSADCRVLVLDEPTAALAAEQAAVVHARMAELAGAGASVIYISHRLIDVLAVADTVTVLRDGRVVSSGPTAGTSEQQMLQEMTGRNSLRGATQSTAAAAGRVLLDVRALTTVALPSPIDLSCRSGEILGIAGLAGAGKSELLQAIFGLQKASGGQVIRHLEHGPVVIRNAREAVLAGTGFLPEDRKSMGLYPGLSVLTNLMTPGSMRLFGALRAIRRRAERQVADGLIGKLAIRCTGPGQSIAELSGGNQQKALLGRWLRMDADVLLLDEPTRGVDVGTKMAIYELLFERRAQGRAAVVASSELEELMTLCDRIVVLSNRAPVAEFERGRWSEEAILGAAFTAFAARPGEDQQDRRP